jgi:hypothetical protein|tara:strand:+ start:542 stop:802 length:261 start_codon:yes stop_codon:yes gene_type:complete
MLESIQYKAARVWGTCETPGLLYLLSLQATDAFWSSVWLILAMAKFIKNVYLDYLITAQRARQIEVIKGMHEGFEEYQKKNKESKK